MTADDRQAFHHPFQNATEHHKPSSSSSDPCPTLHSSDPAPCQPWAKECQPPSALEVLRAAQQNTDRKLAHQHSQMALLSVQLSRIDAQLQELKLLDRNYLNRRTLFILRHKRACFPDAVTGGDRADYIRLCGMGREGDEGDEEEEGEGFENGHGQGVDAAQDAMLYENPDEGGRTDFFVFTDIYGIPSENVRHIYRLDPSSRMLSAINFYAELRTLPRPETLYARFLRAAAACDYRDAEFRNPESEVTVAYWAFMKEGLRIKAQSLGSQ